MYKVDFSKIKFLIFEKNFKKSIDILKKICYNMFRIYDIDQFSMYRMGFDEINLCEKIIESLFEGGYKQIVSDLQQKQSSKYSKIL